MDDAPFCIVVIEQSLEVGYIDKSLVICSDVKVSVMSLILTGTEVAQEGNTLCKGSDKLEVESDK